MSQAERSPNSGPLSPVQVREIHRLLTEMKEFSAETIEAEVKRFLYDLQLPEHYFQTTPIPSIAEHIAALKAARILSRARSDQEGDPELVREEPDRATYVLLDQHEKAVEVEHRIEARYPNTRILSFRAPGNSGTSALRLYFANPLAPAGQPSPGETDIKKLGDAMFLSTTNDETLARYQRVMDRATQAVGPHIEISDKKETHEKRIMVAAPAGVNPGYFSAISDAINAYELHSNRKYREPFANGITVFTVYVDWHDDEATWRNLEEDLSLLYAVPQTGVLSLFHTGKLSAQAAAYAFAAGTFALQFLTGFQEEYAAISGALKDRPELMGQLQALRQRLVKSSYSEERITQAISKHQGLVQGLYEHFHSLHAGGRGAVVDSTVAAREAELVKQIRKDVPSENDRKILSSLLDFNRLVLRTNFYKNEKLSLSFRLDPKLLEGSDYPEIPFGIYFVLASEFRGFHIRFRDIARGGIRIVKSPNAEVYRQNSETAFDENYNLAHTQQKKNKDIPEGGSKGVILLSPSGQDHPQIAFEKYIHGLLDLMLPNEEVRDHLNHEEILFLGPDEWTADLMDTAANLAKRRGYKFWRAFTTGKRVEMGGIPHDLYGMTTRSVHEMAVRTIEKLGLKEEQITKLQTGGPDGDLGSNEILISKDKTLGVVDGSGVLFDPNGIDRNELSRLARARQMVEHFDRRHLSSKGFLVHINDKDVKLPDGTFVENGTDFRNTFHLSSYARADIFVPCGGRPRAVNINNWKRLLLDDGTPKFRAIIEGANLFITQEARLELEKAGVIILKDASANKGGVTSSSLEVLSALALQDSEFQELMTVQGGRVSEFRKDYVESIQTSVHRNAALEFERLWQEHEATHTPRAVLTDEVSAKINQVTDAVRGSDLWNEPALRNKVITMACPPVLLERIGLERILERVPQSYLRAMFASTVASRFVYEYGLHANEIDFLNFVRKLAA